VDARGSHAEFVVARLKPQVAFQAAQTEMDTIAKRIEKDWKPYLNGQIDLAKAVQRQVTEYSVAK
jgi:hypothetical protein